MNIAICSILLREFCQPFMDDILSQKTSNQKLGKVSDLAHENENEEIIEICQWIANNRLSETFFPEEK